MSPRNSGDGRNKAFDGGFGEKTTTTLDYSAKENSFRGTRRRGFRRGLDHKIEILWNFILSMMTMNIYKDGMVVCCPIRARKYSRGVESQGYQLCTLQLPPEFRKWRPIRRVLCCQNVPKVSVPTVK